MKTETKYTILWAAVSSFLLMGSILTNRADPILLSAPSANRSYYGMYSPYVTAASFTLASSYDVSTIDVVLRTPASTSFTTFHFSLQDALTGPVTIFASQDLAAPLGVASTEVMNVNQTLPAGTYYLAGIVPGYAGTPVTPGDVDGWLLSSGVYTQAAGTIANGVWAGNPPAFDTGGVYVAPAFIVNGSVVPEPSTWAMLGAGIAFLLAFRRRNQVCRILSTWQKFFPAIYAHIHRRPSSDLEPFGLAARDQNSE